MKDNSWSGRSSINRAEVSIKWLREVVCSHLCLIVQMIACQRYILKNGFENFHPRFGYV